MNVLGVMYFSRHKKLFYTSDLPLAFRRIKTKDRIRTVHSLTLPLANRPPPSKSEPCLLPGRAWSLHQPSTRGGSGSPTIRTKPQTCRGKREPAAGRQAGVHRLTEKVAVTAVPTAMSLVLRRTIPHGTAIHFVWNVKASLSFGDGNNSAGSDSQI